MNEVKCYHLEVELILHPLPGEAMKKRRHHLRVSLICYKKIALLLGGGNPLTPYFSLH